jgi:hypothetical protein
MSTASNKTVRSRDDLVRQARGYFAETVDQRQVAASGVLVSGLATYGAVGLYAEEKISNLSISIIGTLGSGVTLSKMGIYSSTGALLASTADQGTSWQSSIGLKTMPLTTPYVVPVTGVYYLGILCVFTTTGPTVSRICSGGVFPQFAMPGALSAYYAQTGLADLPNPATFTTTNVTTAFVPWCGLS